MHIDCDVTQDTICSKLIRVKSWLTILCDSGRRGKRATPEDHNTINGCISVLEEDCSYLSKIGISRPWQGQLLVSIVMHSNHKYVLQVRKRNAELVLTTGLHSMVVK